MCHGQPSPRATTTELAHLEHQSHRLKRARCSGASRHSKKLEHHVQKPLLTAAEKAQAQQRRPSTANK